MKKEIDMEWLDQRLGGIEKAIELLEDRLKALEAQNGRKKGKSR